VNRTTLLFPQESSFKAPPKSGKYTLQLETLAISTTGDNNNNNKLTEPFLIRSQTL
jgi:hypothetical protein